MVIVSIFSSPRETYDSYIIFIMLVSGIIIAGIGTIIWIRRGITRIYMKNLKEHNTKELEQKLLEKDKEIQRLNELVDVLQTMHHKIGKRLSAWENGTSKIVDSIKNGKYSTELGEEFAVALDDMIRLTQDYDNGISQINTEKPLPSTNIKGIDDMFDYYSRKYSNENIEFTLQVNGSIPYLVETIIEQSDLETLIGDLLENSLTAVNASDKIFCSVLAIIGVKKGCYEFTVFDSGIPFEIEKLRLLGKERVTTHSDTGGSGIGFMTTFETMKACGASLIINEKPPNERDYTKSVTVRFNGENRYLIESYRFGDVFKREEEYTVI